MKELYERYLELLDFMKKSDNGVEATLWMEEIDKLKEQNKLKGMYNRVLFFENGIKYPDGNNLT